MFRSLLPARCRAGKQESPAKKAEKPARCKTCCKLLQFYVKTGCRQVNHLFEVMQQLSVPSGDWYWCILLAYCVYSPPRTCLTPHNGWTPWDINVTYTSLKSAWATIPSLTIWVYLHSLSCYCLRNTRNVAKFSKWIWPYGSARSSMVIHLGVNVNNFLLVINCNFSRICYRFRDIQA